MLHRKGLPFSSCRQLPVRQALYAQHSTLCMCFLINTLS